MKRYTVGLIAGADNLDTYLNSLATEGMDYAQVVSITQNGSNYTVVTFV